MFTCKKCNTLLVEDFNMASEAYDGDLKTVLTEDGEIDYKALPTYLIFSCGRCGYFEKIEISTIIKNLQKKIVKTLFYKRLDLVYSTADKTKVDEANGISFCGMCPGVIDESGYCYNDVISQCIIRKTKLNDI